MTRPNPDTHNPAVQASAYGLIQLLQAAYPEIGRLPSIISSQGQHDAASMQQEQVLQAQASLLQQIHALIAPSKYPALSEEEKAIFLANPCISGTMGILDAIQSIPEETLASSDKINIFRQISFIVRSYPGGDWDAAREQWSINARYNSTIGCDERNMTSPAEALNLVCRALMDETRFSFTDEETKRRDFALRLSSFCGLVKDMVPIEGSYQKCSAGIQHDLLYILNRSFLDKPHAEGGQPIILLMDTETFLQETISLFIADQLQRNERREQVVLDWIRWKADISATDLERCPLIAWLRIQFPTSLGESVDVGWQRACTVYLENRCMAFGLNPSRCFIGAYVAELPNAPTPSGVITPLVAEIVAMQPLPVRSQAPFPENSFDQLLGLYNAALARFREFRPDTEHWYTLNSEAIDFLFSAVNCISSLYRYRDLTLMIGAEDAQFQRDREAIQAFLVAYFIDFTPGKRCLLAGEFERLRQDYTHSEREFLTQNSAEFIGNFFAVVHADPNEFEGAWARFMLLQPEGSVVHPVVLTDAAIEAWREQSGSVSADGTSVIDITPYAINRMLLHGLLVNPENWTPMYCQSLLLLTRWLATPSVADEPLALRTLKQVYHHSLLANSSFIALLVNSEMAEATKRACLNSIQRQYLFHRANQQFYNNTLISNLLVDLSPEDRTEVFRVFQGQWSVLILGGDQLAHLLCLRGDQLSSEQCTQIWTEVQGQLASIINNEDGLILLLTLKIGQLNAEQRTQIWNVVQEQYDRLIPSAGCLADLFELREEQLNAQQRARIWASVQGRLDVLIEDSDDLVRLFKLGIEKLNMDQRNQILAAVQYRLNHLLIDKEDLIELLQLATSKLNADQRAQLWIAIQGHLGSLIENGEDLFYFLELDRDQITEEQQAQVWAIVQGNFEALIDNGDDLISLLELDTDQLNARQRNQIFAEVRGNLVNLIDSGEQLALLFHLDIDQLNLQQRTLVWTALTGNFDNLIRNGNEFFSLWRLSSDELNSVQRAQIWTEIHVKLGDLIRTGDDLVRLFELSVDQLNVIQRAQVWTAVEQHIPRLIRTNEQVQRLFLLSYEQLSSYQRNHILSVLPRELTALLDWAIPSEEPMMRGCTFGEVVAPPGVFAGVYYGDVYSKELPPTHFSSLLFSRRNDVSIEGSGPTEDLEPPTKKQRRF